MPQPVTQSRSTTRTRAVLVLSLLCWIGLCAWVWLLLSEPGIAPQDVTLARVDAPSEPDRHLNPGTTPEPNTTPAPAPNTNAELTDAVAGAGDDRQIRADAGTDDAEDSVIRSIRVEAPSVDGEDSAASERDSVAITSIPGETSPSSSRPELSGSAGSQGSGESEGEDGPTTDRPTADRDADGLTNQNASTLPVGLEPVPDDTSSALVGLSNLLDDLPDVPAGDGSEGSEPVTIPLAPEPVESSYERQRREELAVLDSLSSRLVFEPGSAERSARVQRVLDRIFDPLFLYADTNVEVIVNSNDLASPADNRRLSRLRGRVIVDYLAQRGLDTSRFVVVSEGGRGLPIGANRVRVTYEVQP